MTPDHSHPPARHGRRASVARALAAGLACWLGAVSAEDAQRIPMSDAEVRAFGEVPASGAFFRLPHDPLLDNTDARASHAKAINATQYTSIAGIEFRPRSDADEFGIQVYTQLFCHVGATNSLAEAQLQLPDGARFQFLRIYATDADENAMNVALVERCQPIAAAGNVVTTVLGTVLTTGSAGILTQSVAIPGDVAVDNVQCSYGLRAQFGSTVNGCAPSMALDKVRVQWLE